MSLELLRNEALWKIEKLGHIDIVIGTLHRHCSSQGWSAFSRAALLYA